MFWIVLIALGVAWLAQTWFSFRQSQAFAKLFVSLRRKGRVAMGRFKGGLVQGAIVLFVIDDDGIIQEGYKLQGVTVAARFRRFTLYDGQDLDTIDPADTKKFGGPAVKAVANARSNYQIVQSGGQAPEPPSALSRVLLKLPLPKWGKKKPAPTQAVMPIVPQAQRIKISRTPRAGEDRSPMAGSRYERTA